MIENYKKYLNMLNEKLTRFFEKQKPYIFCKKGCAKCCQNAQFPFTEIEFKYLIEGLKQLPLPTQNQIQDNIKKVLENKKAYDKKWTIGKKEPFTYDCPFLINNSCAVYHHRGIICRTFGLLNKAPENDGSHLPFCALIGLNYSNVYDPETKKISAEKFEKLGIDIEPIAFNIDYNFLTEEAFGKGYGFEFGKTKPLIDWFDI
ncbi:MAG: YkgJ family cysteine cluster protein [Cyanobacteria bacterium SIG26]|nr:YkgJ family cysteine cluster protein [Cyanobacteria bacterium SIG26]